MISKEQVSIFILCGGRGSRMGKYTQDLPKPLVHVRGRPMLSYLLENFHKHGYEDIVLGTGYRHEKVEDFINDTYSDSKRPLLSNAGEKASMLERIHYAKNNLKKYVIVCYGDTYIDINYEDLLNTHIDNQSVATLITGKIKNPFGIISIDDRGRISTFKEKPVFDYYIGSFIFSKDFFSKMTEDHLAKPDGEGLVNVFQELIDENKLYSYPHTGLQITFNTEDELKSAEEGLQQYFTLREE